jgi:DNA-binding NarL/FixJ family response regulator
MASQAPLPKKQDVNGGSPTTGSIAREIVQSFQEPADLPASASGVALASREREVLDLLARGLAYKEISHKLGVSRYTIMTLVQRIYRKLHVHSRGEAVAKHFALFNP